MIEASPSTQAELRVALDSLEETLDTIRGDRAANDGETAEELESIELILQTVSRNAHVLEEGTAFGEVSDLLLQVRDWAHLVKGLQLGQALRESHAITQSLAERSLEGWQTVCTNLSDDITAENCFQTLLRASMFEFTTANHEGTTTHGSELLADIRAHIRAGLLRCIEKDPPTDAQRQQWATALKDGAASLMADLPSLSPEVASQQLHVVREDFQWYLDNVEKEEGIHRKRLLKTEHRLLVEWQERVLQARLEGRFGQKPVLYFERLIFWLILGVLALLTVEGFADLSPRTVFWFIVTDTAICGVFLLEFFVKLYYAPLRWLWFRRHLLFDLLPSIPFGLLGLHTVDSLRAGRLMRLFRLTRFARYLRVARGLIRLVRILGFLTRGIDRIARQYAFLLRCKVILYPTREERIRCAQHSDTLLDRARELQAEVGERWKHLLLASPDELQPELALARLRPLQSAANANRDDRPLGLPEFGKSVTDERTAHSLIRQCSNVTAQEISRQFPAPVIARFAHIIRILAYPPFRWLPIISSCVPRVNNHETDADLVADVGQNIGKLLGAWHNRWFWVRDLYGTITPSQFVDRVGSLMVRWAIRPAYRLTLFGIFLLLTELFLRYAGFSALEPIRQFLYRVLGLPIVILGALCLLIVAVGYWMQRLAQEATDFYEESALAQFLQLTEVIRPRYISRDAEIFYRRVILPEHRIHQGLERPESNDELAKLIEMTRALLMGDYRSHDPCSPFDPVERTVLLYRDYLDGALLADSDTRTTSQLLGNPALRRFRTWSRRFDKYAEKSLQRLTLTRQRLFLGGPYFWFLLIVRSISHLTAQHIIEYNRNVLPLGELDRATEEELRRHQTWLDAGDDDSALPFMEYKEDAYAYVVTTAFTALHFLDDEAQRDREVAERFGPAVLERLQSDRSVLIRRIFGTYPMHRLPKEDRVVDLYSAYEYWLGGGRILFLPMLLLLKVCRHVGQFLRWLWKCVSEIRRPESRMNPDDAADAGFLTAVRKIDRMRGPIVRASMRLRAIVDPEYLGVPLPGLERTTTPEADLDADCRFLDLEPAFIDELVQDRERAEADMQRLSRILETGLLDAVAERLGVEPSEFRTPVYIRATAVLYLANYLSLRELLSCEEILAEVYERAAEQGALPMRPWPNVRLRWMFWSYCREHTLPKGARNAAWQATVHNLDGVADALRVWYSQREKARERGLEILANLLRHPSRIEEELVTLRAVQTMAVLDVLHYREHVYRLGNYSADDEHLDELLTWGEQVLNRDSIAEDV